MVGVVRVGGWFPGNRCAAALRGGRRDCGFVGREEVCPSGLALGLRREVGCRVVVADVVAFRVVGVLAESLTVLLGDFPAFSSLLDGKAYPAALEIDVDDLHPELLTGCDDLLGQIDVVRRHLRNVHKTLDTIAHLDESAKGHELGDPAVDELADPVVRGELLPRIDLGRLQ